MFYFHRKGNILLKEYETETTQVRMDSTSLVKKNSFSISSIISDSVPNKSDRYMPADSTENVTHKNKYHQQQQKNSLSSESSYLSEDEYKSPKKQKVSRKLSEDSSDSCNNNTKQNESDESTKKKVKESPVFSEPQSDASEYELNKHQQLINNHISQYYQQLNTANSEHHLSLLKAQALASFNSTLMLNGNLHSSNFMKLPTNQGLLQPVAASLSSPDSSSSSLSPNPIGNNPQNSTPLTNSKVNYSNISHQFGPLAIGVPTNNQPPNESFSPNNYKSQKSDSQRWVIE